MRFKVHFNEVARKVEVNCLNENSDQAMLPNNPDQHVMYPIPMDMKKKLQPVLNNLIPESATKEFIEIDRLTKELTERRRAFMTELRKEMNPQIFEACKQFKLDNAEFFI